jgi:hypothetical protein
MIQPDTVNGDILVYIYYIYMYGEYVFAMNGIDVLSG